MPTIIENTQQVNALNEIEAALAIIKSINTMPDASRAKAIGILSTTKDRLVKDVKSKAAKFHIGLDEADLACMGDIQQSELSDDGQPENDRSDTAKGPTENVHPSEESLPTEFEGDIGNDESLI